MTKSCFAERLTRLNRAYHAHMQAHHSGNESLYPPAGTEGEFDWLNEMIIGYELNVGEGVVNKSRSDDPNPIIRMICMHCVLKTQDDVMEVVVALEQAWEFFQEHRPAPK